MPSKNNLSALKKKPEKSILPSNKPSESSSPAQSVAQPVVSPVASRAGGHVGRPKKAEKEKRSYKITLSLTQAEGTAVKAKAGLAREASVVYDHLLKTGFFD